MFEGASNIPHRRVIDCVVFKLDSEGWSAGDRSAISLAYPRIEPISTVDILVDRAGGHDYNTRGWPWHSRSGTQY